MLKAGCVAAGATCSSPIHHVLVTGLANPGRRQALPLASFFLCFLVLFCRLNFLFVLFFVVILVYLFVIFIDNICYPLRAVLFIFLSFVLYFFPDIWLKFVTFIHSTINKSFHEVLILWESS